MKNFGTLKKMLGSALAEFFLLEAAVVMGIYITRVPTIMEGNTLALFVIVIVCLLCSAFVKYTVQGKFKGHRFLDIFRHE